MFEGKHVYAVVLAGGSGSRFGGDVPKQFQMLGDAPVFLHSMRIFDKIGIIDGIVLVAPTHYLGFCQNLISQHNLTKVIATVKGGESRQESTYLGLKALIADADSIVLVHDAARPFVCADDVTALVDAAHTYTSAILALPVADTIKLADETKLAIQTINRENLYAAKTPQAARMADLRNAHEAARQDGFVATDDCQLMENIGIYSKIVITSARNIKITTAADLDFAAFLLEKGMI